MQVAWPEHALEPINEFNCPDFLARTYPTLFPYGDCQLRAVRRVTVSPEAYFKHLMRHHSGKFAQHRRFRYTAMNCELRWRAASLSKVFVQRTMPDKTVADILQEVRSQSNVSAQNEIRSMW